MNRKFHYRALGALVGAVTLLTLHANAAVVNYIGAINVGQPLGRIVADPVRGKVYGITDSGNVLFMDRASLSVEKTIPTGRKLTDIDVATDGSFMTVLDNVTREYWGQPPAVYVLKYDLNTQTQNGITLVNSPLFHMALGRPNRIAGVGVNQWVSVYHNDLTTGQQLSSSGGGYFGSGSTDWQTLTLVTNPAGTRLYRTDIGISSIDVLSWDISGDTMVPAGSRTVGSYSTEPVFINSSGSSLYVGDIRLNPMNLSQVLGLFPENIYAATADDRLAFSAGKVYDPTFGTFVENLPVNSTKLVLGESDRYLYAFDSATNKLHVMSVPEPATGLLMLSALLMMKRQCSTRRCNSANAIRERVPAS